MKNGRVSLSTVTRAVIKTTGGGFRIDGQVTNVTERIKPREIYKGRKKGRRKERKLTEREDTCYDIFNWFINSSAIQGNQPQ